MNNDINDMIPEELFIDRRIPDIEFDEHAQLDEEDEGKRTKLLEKLARLIAANQKINPTAPNKLEYGIARIELIDYDPKVKPRIRRTLNTTLTQKHQTDNQNVQETISHTPQTHPKIP